MKKILVSLVAMMFLFAPLAFAVSITINNGAIDVGGVDTFIASTILGNASPATQTKWVNDILNPTTATFVVKDEDVKYFATNTNGVFAFYLGAPVVEFFLVKNARFSVLFQNVDNMLWGVFNATNLPAGMNIPSSDFTISHVTRFNEVPVPVPEPTTLLLFGAGIAGLALYRRKRN